MSRILFLDDCPARTKWAMENLDDWELTSGRGFPLFLTAATAEGAIEVLEWADPTLGFDAVYLDHDLGGETHVDSSRPDTGMGVVRWIVEYRPIIGKVIVHSMNAPAANEMVAKLRDAGYAAEYINFLRLVRESS